MHKRYTLHHYTHTSYKKIQVGCYFYSSKKDEEMKKIQHIDTHTITVQSDFPFHQNKQE